MLDLSLGIPLYNASRFLDELFVCLRGLNPSPREIVFLDDASSDDSLSRARQFAKDFLPNVAVRVLSNEHNLGIAGSYNRLVKETSGEWLQILDADDLFTDTDFYQQIAAHLRAENDVVVTALRSNKRLLDRCARLVAPLIPLQPPAWLPLLGSVATRAGVLYRRARLVQQPFPDPAYAGSDVIHLLELRAGGRCVFLRGPSVRYRIHGAAQSSQLRDYSIYRQQLVCFDRKTQIAHGLDLHLRQFGQRLIR
ncbi:glycosyltransferase family 2 protein [Pseudolysobacter antarcticus]|uniref:glycosyltransferase family 2 protein n=1 Tax=Pseudolysobacter antarcticus TaxID=2511995 RepID=UPI0013EB6147|nr:glycosyltransferase [Pseudolysobacter antarcticus]